MDLNCLGSDERNSPEAKARSVPPNERARVSQLGLESPRMAVSLWDMIRLNCLDWIYIDSEIITFQINCELAAKESNRASFLTETELKDIGEIIKLARNNAKTQAYYNSETNLLK